MRIADNNPLAPGARRFAIGALAVGVIFLALCAAGAMLINPQQFFQSYLVGYLFWLGMALGCMMFVMLHHVGGGRWAGTALRFMEAGMRTLPGLAVLFIPILVGMRTLYPWTDPQRVAAEQILQYKQPYLNIPFFIGRAVFYFVVWIALAYLLSKWSVERDQHPSREISSKLRLLSGWGIVLVGITASFAMIDWVMSLEPQWYSSVYAGMVVMGQVLAALAFVVLVVVWLGYREPVAGMLSPNLLNDLGSLLLAFVIIWAYLSYSQFMLIWAGNLTEEIPWYLRRLQGGWQWVALALVLLDFALPFLLLIIRDVKRNRKTLIPVAALLFVMHYVALAWLIKPAFSPQRLTLSWLDLATPIGVGGVWLALYAWRLSQRPLIAANDPQIQAIEMVHEA